MPALIDAGITESVLRILRKYDAKLFLLTKGGSPNSSIVECIKAMRDSIQIIISNSMPNEEIRQKLEPCAPSISDRFEFARLCVSLGVATTAIFAPILPIAGCSYIKEYIREYLRIGVTHFRLDFPELSVEGMNRVHKLLPEYSSDFNIAYDGSITTLWKIPFKEISVERTWPSLRYMRSICNELDAFARGISPYASTSVCNSLCVKEKLGNFNAHAHNRGFSCIGVRQSMFKKN